MTSAKRGRPSNIPEHGDVSKKLVAQRLGLTEAEFDAHLPRLQKRDFPNPDETTGLYCIEAVDRWRLRRHGNLFPELTSAPAAMDANAVYKERLAGLK
jgi:hypothetical protein